MVLPNVPTHCWGCFCCNCPCPSCTAAVAPDAIVPAPAAPLLSLALPRQHSTHCWVASQETPLPDNKRRTHGAVWSPSSAQTSIRVCIDIGHAMLGLVSLWNRNNRCHRDRRTRSTRASKCCSAAEPPWRKIDGNYRQNTSALHCSCCCCGCFGELASSVASNATPLIGKKAASRVDGLAGCLAKQDNPPGCVHVCTAEAGRLHLPRDIAREIKNSTDSSLHVGDYSILELNAGTVRDAILYRSCVCTYIYMLQSVHAAAAYTTMM